MSGHSKWSKIKRKKGANDAKRSKIFSKIIKEITVAARDGGGDPDGNPRLRLAIQNAKGANMGKDLIERAISKGAGDDAANLQELTFEGYASHGIAVFVDCTTDNNNRTVQQVRAVFSKHGGELGKNGSLSYLFNQKGIFDIESDKLEGWDMEELEMELIDGGLEEMNVEDDHVQITVAFEDFGKMGEFLETKGIETSSGEVQRIPNNTKEIDVSDAKSVLKLVDAMEEVDDVDSVYHNLEMTDALAEALEAEG